MEIGRFRTGGTAVICLIVLLSVSVTPVAAGVETPAGSRTVSGEDLENETVNSSHRGPAKLESDLRATARSKTTAAQAQGQTLQVVVEALPGKADRAAAAVARYGTVTGRAGTQIEARLPASHLDELSNTSSVAFVREPYVPTPFVTSEGIQTIAAAEEHTRGFTGSNTTVAVIDLGFDPDHPEIADNVVATKDFTGDGIEQGPSDHGTAVSEVVVDTAPNTSLVLISVSTSTDIQQAVDYVNNHEEIDVASMSLGLQGYGPLDGSSQLDQDITDSVSQGHVWTISAGNEGNGDHWNGTWTDPDGDGILNFNGNDETNAINGPVDVRLQWNDWQYSDQDYDLYLLDSSGSVVAQSTTTQSGSQPPVERLTYNGGETYYLVVDRYNADGAAKFDLWSVGGSNFEYWTRTRTITIPATATGATTIGAVYYETATLEDFSSRGPTIDGRLGVDLVAPDGVSTATYSSGFFGTSAAAPHAAGAIALLASANTSLSPSDLETRLERTAGPVLGTEPNAKTGYGLINVTAALPPQNPSTTTIQLDAINRSTTDAVPLSVAFDAPPKESRVSVVVEDESGTTVTTTVPASDTRTTSLQVNVSTLRDGSLTASAIVHDTFGHGNPAGVTAQSAPVRKDTIRPSVTSYNVTSPDPERLKIAFTTSEPVTEATLELRNEETGNTTTVHESLATDTTSYAFNYSADAGATYTVTLETVRDRVGNTRQVAASQTVEVLANPYAVATSNVSNVSSSKVTLRGEVLGMGNASAVETNFEYWVAGQKDTTKTWVSDDVLTSPDSFNATVSGLQPNTTYVVKAIGYNATTGWTEGTTIRFETESGYHVASRSPTAVTASQATLEGELVGMGGASEVETNFEYWVAGQKDTTKTWLSDDTLTSIGPFNATVTGLESNTTYVVKAIGYNSTLGWTEGHTTTFSTPSGYQATTDDPTEISAESATLNGNLSGLGGASAVETNFEYWVKGEKQNTSTWVSDTTLTSTGPFNATVSGLDPNTTYVAKAIGYNSTLGWTEGSTVEFATAEEYTVSTAQPTSVNSSTATLEGELVGMGGASEVETNFEYWVKGEKQNTSAWVSVKTLTTPGTFSAQIEGVEANTTYVVKAIGYNSSHGWTEGSTVEFTT